MHDEQVSGSRKTYMYKYYKYRGICVYIYRFNLPYISMTFILCVNDIIHKFEYPKSMWMKNTDKAIFLNEISSKLNKPKLHTVLS